MPGYSRARGQTSDEEVVELVAGLPAAARSGAESEGFTFVDALKRAKLMAASDREIVIDTF